MIKGLSYSIILFEGCFAANKCEKLSTNNDIREPDEYIIIK